MPVPPRPHVLIATDLAPEFRPHVEFAARLADRLHAHVTLFHAALPVTPAMHGAPLLPTSPLVADPQEGTRRALQELADAVRKGRPLHVATTAATDAASAVLAAAASARADLIVLPTHARTGLKRLVLGSVAESVLRHSRLPVVLLSDKMVAAPSASTGNKPRPIVLTSDHSESASKAFPVARELAQRFALPIVLLSVAPRTDGPLLSGGLPIAAPPVDARRRQDELLPALRQLATSLGTGIAVDAQVVVDDDIAAAINRTAQDLDAAFVVMATHGRSGLARVLLGSVAEAVVHHGRVPVVCVPARA